MRTTLLAIVVAVLPLSTAAAEPSGHQKPDKSANPGRLLPVKRAGAGNACATYGPGFARADGTETCVKIGGGVGIRVGGSR